MRNYDGVETFHLRTRKFVRYYMGKPLGIGRFSTEHFWRQTAESRLHRLDGPALVQYNAKGEITKQHYWVEGVRLRHMQRYINMIRDTTNKDAKFCKIIEGLYQDVKTKRRIVFVLANHPDTKDLISEKLLRATLAALELL